MFLFYFLFFVKFAKFIKFISSMKIDITKAIHFLLA